jgi:glutathione S-transferase
MAHYTLVLGTKNWSSWSLRAYLALRATQTPFEEIVLRLKQADTRERIKQYSSAGKVPVLKIVENGRTTTVWDSLSICEALAERHPLAQLWPEDARMRSQARSYAAEMHSGYPDLRELLPMDFARSHALPELNAGAKEQIARIIEAWNKALTKHGGDCLFGHFTIADAMYAPVASRFTSYGVELPPKVKDYCARIMALPAMVDWMAAAKAEVAAGVA